jgi:hypothetical protein
MSIKMFNKVPSEIKILIHDTKLFNKCERIYFVPILFIQYVNILIILLSVCIVLLST